MPSRWLVKPVLEVTWVDDVKLCIGIVTIDEIRHPDVAVWVCIPMLLDIMTENFVRIRGHLQPRDHAVTILADKPSIELQPTVDEVAGDLEVPDHSKDVGVDVGVVSE